MEQLKQAYLDKEKIHFIVDNGPYYTSNLVKQKAVELGITMVYLPPYSPNSNPIKRLWKYMNEKIRNNVFFIQPKISSNQFYLSLLVIGIKIKLV